MTIIKITIIANIIIISDSGLQGARVVCNLFRDHASVSELGSPRELGGAGTLIDM